MVEQYKVGKLAGTIYDKGVEVGKGDPLSARSINMTCEVDRTVQVTQVWDSEEYARRYDEEVLKPALKLAGAPMDAEIHTFELLHLVTP